MIALMLAPPKRSAAPMLPTFGLVRRTRSIRAMIARMSPARA